MNQQPTSTGTTGASSAHDLFALTDEQILEIEPQSTGPNANVAQVAGQENASRVGAQHTAPQLGTMPAESSSSTSHDTRISSSDLPSHSAHAEVPVLPEPPPWLAAQMKDPWEGEEAREFWNGVQQARTDAASYQAYQATFANPEEARALKDLYPGGMNEARSASERARFLDEIDHAYFGGAGKPPEEISAARAQLAQQLLREDPAAFREMVEAGLKLLGVATEAPSARAKSLASLVSSSAQQSTDVPASSVGAQHAAPQLGNTSANDAHVAAYAAFERAANADLERTVGGAIDRTLTQALPVAQPFLAVRGGEAQSQAPALRERLNATIRADIEKSLQGDRQLSEQVAQILSSRRFDDDARAQVVRLIGERAQQLVPGAAKRVLNEWTQTTLAANSTRTQRNDTDTARLDAMPARSEAAPASPELRRASLSARASQESRPMRRLEASATGSCPLDYRKLSDEQILDL